MPLTSQQRAALEAKAKEIGVDPAKLIAEAEALASASAASPDTKSAPDVTTEKPKLFMYLLPFVTVKEVRANWLGLSDSFAGDNEIASAWAAKQSGAAPDPNGDPNAGQ